MKDQNHHHLCNRHAVEYMTPQSFAHWLFPRHRDRHERLLTSVLTISAECTIAMSIMTTRQG